MLYHNYVVTSIIYNTNNPVNYYYEYLQISRKSFSPTLAVTEFHKMIRKSKIFKSIEKPLDKKQLMNIINNIKLS